MKSISSAQSFFGGSASPKILAFTRNDIVFSDYYGNLFSSDDVSDLIHRVRKSYAENTGKDLDFYAYLMRKSMVSDNRRDKVNPSATKLLLGHQSENIAGRWYASADDKEVLNLVSLTLRMRIGRRTQRMRKSQLWRKMLSHLCLRQSKRRLLNQMKMKNLIRKSHKGKPVCEWF